MMIDPRPLPIDPDSNHGRESVRLYKTGPGHRESWAFVQTLIPAEFRAKMHVTKNMYEVQLNNGIVAAWLWETLAAMQAANHVKMTGLTIYTLK